VHHLRHTYRSLLLARGAPVERVSERLGHSTPIMTLKVYRHLLDSERQGWVIDLEDVAQ
jgi:integrase